MGLRIPLEKTPSGLAVPSWVSDDRRLCGAVKRGVEEGVPDHCFGQILCVKDVNGEAVTGKKGFDPNAALQIVGMANKNMEDRYREVLSPVGCDTRNFMLSPILLADHSYTCKAAVGQVSVVNAEEDGVHFEAWIGDPQKAPLTEMQTIVRSLVAQGILKTVSVGFLPKKIKYPIYNDDGEIVEPAVIESWELLELSIVAVPCNPESVFDMKEYRRLFVDFGRSIGNANNCNDSSENLGEQGGMGAKAATDNPKSMIVQTLIFAKETFKKKEEAVKWAIDHGFKNNGVDETADSFRLRQREPGDFDDATFRTIDLTDGVKAVVGKLKKDISEKEQSAMDEMLKQMMESLVALSEGVKAIGLKCDEILKACSAEEPASDNPPAEEPPAKGEEEPTKGVAELETRIAGLEGSIEKIGQILEVLVKGQTK